MGVVEQKKIWQVAKCGDHAYYKGRRFGTIASWCEGGCCLRLTPELTEETFVDAALCWRQPWQQMSPTPRVTHILLTTEMAFSGDWTFTAPS